MKVVNKAFLHDRLHVGDTGALSRALSERNVGVMARRSSCPYILELHASFQTPENFYYITEYCPYGDLFGILQVQASGIFKESEARFYAAEIVVALTYLHTHGVIHRDVKLENVLLASDCHVMLADFGSACLGVPQTASDVSSACSHDASSADSKNGLDGNSPNRAAIGALLQPPEFWRGAACGKDIDCWQLGLALFLMLVGHYPTSTALTSSPDWPGELLPHNSAAATDICCALLNRKRKCRLGYPDGAVQLRGHSFFTALDWSALEKKAIEPPFKGDAVLMTAAMQNHRVRNGSSQLDMATVHTQDSRLRGFSFNSADSEAITPSCQRGPHGAALSSQDSDEGQESDVVVV
eukprot:NODE_10040_length_1381_cov_2.332536.p1 GENE.NODE_10040_length_1381_cov_2.332536~~NODE_10040_length_1381_cov_2.332536.p1  ORF type:complete len:353 (-),score=59.92 NODE_10040_length_1381_cov_2.332536:146-1204(-)